MASDPSQRFGPWSPGLEPGERVAQFRSLAGISASFLGSGHPLVASLRAAETGDADAGERAIRDLHDVPALTRRRMLSVFGAITWPSKRASAPTRNTRRAVRHTIMETAMKMSDAFRGKSKYFRAADVQDRPIALTIEHVEFEVMSDGASKPVARFAEDGRGLVLNKANYSSITQIAGSDDTVDWRGLRIVLFAGTAEFAGNVVPAVRIRNPHGTRASATPQKQSPRDDMDDSIPF
jgi:hypothetical protein